MWRERGFQALHAEVCFVFLLGGFIVIVYQRWQAKICDQFI
jgi:hypothetical protein